MPDHVKQRRHQAAEWLRNHGVNPNRYPQDNKLTPEPGGWWVEIAALNDQGRPHYDRLRNKFATEVVHIADDGNPPPAWLLPAAGLP